MLFEKKIVNIYRKQFLSRCDDNGTAFYFSAPDFPGLHSEPFAFPAAKGHTLQGYFYHYDNPIPGRVVVFDHGFGGGHRAYMKEIALLCHHGYLVFAYDHTGCMESGGENPGGLAQSLSDLNDCLTALKKTALKKTDRCHDLDFSVMGHSWGGFASLNIAALHPEISHIVALSGFVSVEELIGQFFGGPLKGYRKPVMKLERESNPGFVNYNAVQTLSNSNAKVLLVYSANDKMVLREIHYDLLKKGLSGRDNIRFLLVENKSHNPNYTEEAVAYLREYTVALAQKQKKKELQTPQQKKAFLASFDWNRMTDQDPVVWAEIFSTLDK